MFRSRLGTFANEFEHVVRPFLSSLGRAVEGLNGEGGELLAREVLLGLLHARERLQALSAEVADRRGAIFVAGPAKSGKSTLVNALAGASVTKVTALPTYPALTTLRFSPTLGAVVDTYAGEVETYDDAAATRERLRRAEARLAQVVRDVEEAGQSFDPERHAPTGLRRIRVGLPADALARTGIALHEVPADRRFGIGRSGFFDDFRGTPAAAVVVLRPADLFARPLFPELGALVERCGSVFVVVNTDGAARRLEPDGSLVEEVGPDELREAFARTAEGVWQRAFARGRLHVTAIDLLAAARVRFGAAEPTGDEARALAELTRELTRHLDDASATRTFCAESLRSSTALTERVAGLCQASSILDIRDRLGERKDERTEALRQKDAMDRLGRLEPRAWDGGGAFAGVQDGIVQAVRGRSAHHYEALSHAIADRLGAWFASDDGLDDLVRQGVGPLFRTAEREIAALAKAELARLTRREGLAKDLPTGIGNDLDAACIRLEDLSRAAVEAVDVVPALPPIPAPLRMDDVPVRKTWSDRLLVRRMPTVRKRSLDAPDLPGEWKASRLEEGARERLQDVLDERAVRFIAERGDQICRSTMDAFFAGLTQELGAKLALRRERFDPRLSDLEASVRELEGVRDQIADLERASKTIHESLADLTASYVSDRSQERERSEPPSSTASRSQSGAG